MGILLGLVLYEITKCLRNTIVNEDQECQDLIYNRELIMTLEHGYREVNRTAYHFADFGVNFLNELFIFESFLNIQIALEGGE